MGAQRIQNGNPGGPNGSPEVPNGNPEGPHARPGGGGSKWRPEEGQKGSLGEAKIGRKKRTRKRMNPNSRKVEKLLKIKSA